jgi:acetoacetate decarboxylase
MNIEDIRRNAFAMPLTSPALALGTVELDYLT